MYDVLMRERPSDIARSRSRDLSHITTNKIKQKMNIINIITHNEPIESCIIHYPCNQSPKPSQYTLKTKQVGIKQRLELIYRICTLDFYGEFIPEFWCCCK